MSFSRDIVFEREDGSLVMVTIAIDGHAEMREKDDPDGIWGPPMDPVAG